MRSVLAAVTLLGAALSAHAEPAETVPAWSGCGVGTAWPTILGFVVTNDHLVSTRDEIVLVDTAGGTHRARVAVRDSVNDDALLEVDEPDRLPPALPLSGSDVHLGADVFTIGYPRIDLMGSSPKLSQGIVSGVKGVRDDPTSFLVSAPIQPGNSGGPLLDLRGEVVGMVTSMVAVEDGRGELHALPSVNCAVRVAAVRALLDRVTEATAIDVVPAREGDLASVAARVQDSVLIVMAP